MKYPAYPKYKPSGVEWLGEVPEHWEVKRLKRVLSEPLKYGANESAELDDPDLPRYVRITDVHENGSLREETFRSLPKEIAAPYLLSDGDLLFARSGATSGKTFLYRRSWGICAFAGYLIRARMNQRYAVPAFVKYFTNSISYWQWLSSIYIQATIQNVSAEKYADLPLPLPSPAAQRAIADFLDRETAKLDTLVAKKRELLEKLKEKRTALISRTVTRGMPPEAARAAGLNPHPKLKPSGIAWLGEVPEHWEVMMIKRTWSVCEYGISESLSGDGPIKVLTMGNIQEGKVILPDEGCLEMVPQAMLLKKNDLLFNRTNSLVHVGKVGLFDGDEKLEVTFASYLVRIRANSQMSPQFLSYCLNIPQLLEFARSLALPSINQANLNPTRYGQIKVAVPPLTEQRAVADYLDRETAKLDQMAAKVEEALARLQEYRTALITAAVTGKIAVRKYKDAEGVQHQSRG